MNGVVNFLRGLVKTGSQSVVSDPRDHLTSPNGFLREAAVKALSNQPQVGTLPALLERLNDWVPQVRCATQEAVRAQMQTAFLPDWIASLEALVRLGQARRVDHAGMLREVALFLQRSEHLPAVLAAAKASSLHVRRFVFDMQWVNAPDDEARFQLLEGALCGDDVVVVSRALLRLETLASPTQRRRLYGAACCSRFAVARYAGVRWVVENPDEATDSLVRGMGLDASASVRWWCLHWLRAHGGLGQLLGAAESVTRDERVTNRLRLVAMRWLLEADPERAVHVSTDWIDHAHPVLRYEALSIRLVRSPGDAKTQWLERAFDDPSPRVRKLLMHKAHRGYWMPSVAQLTATLLNDPTFNSIRRVLTLRSLYPAWDRLECLLVAWPMGRSQGCEAALVEALDRWRFETVACSHGPEADQAQRIVALWAAARHQLAQPLRQAIDFHLKTFGLL